MNWIDEVGFLPLFANEVEGFSAEEHVSPNYWWTGDRDEDPWEWREIIAASHKVAYGKFFDRKSGQYYVFVVPVKAELNLKKAAKAAGEKVVSMIKQKELLLLTGYVHGGCSPIGMKKQFPTFIHESAEQYECVFVSAGKVGFR